MPQTHNKSTLSSRDKTDQNFNSQNLNIICFFEKYLYWLTFSSNRKIIYYRNLQTCIPENCGGFHTGSVFTQHYDVRRVRGVIKSLKIHNLNFNC